MKAQIDHLSNKIDAFGIKLAQQAKVIAERLEQADRLLAKTAECLSEVQSITEQSKAYHEAVIRLKNDVAELMKTAHEHKTIL